MIRWAYYVSDLDEENKRHQAAKAHLWSRLLSGLEDIPLILCLLLLIGCAVPKPPSPQTPPLPPAKHLLLPKKAINAAPYTATQHTYFIPWQYPPNPGGYVWTLQGSFDLTNWFDIQQGVTEPLTVYTTNAFEFFRLTGQKSGAALLEVPVALQPVSR